MQIKFYQDSDSGTWHFNGQTVPPEYVIMLEYPETNSVNFKPLLSPKAFSLLEQPTIFAINISVSDILKYDGTAYKDIAELKTATAGFFYRDAKPIPTSINMQSFIPSAGQIQFLVTSFTVTANVTIISGGADQTDNCIVAGQTITFDGAMEDVPVRIYNTRIVL